MADIEHCVDEAGNESWKLNGQYHRDDGPAFISIDGTQVWCQHGYLHRVDGPAFISRTGNVEWWIDGKKYPFWYFCRESKLPLDQITELQLKYGYDRTLH